MELERIEVLTRDEYQGAQEPIRFQWRGKGFQVTRIVDRWYEGSMSSTRFPLLYFKVRTSSDELFLLRYHELFRAWSIVVPKDQVENE